MRDAEKDLQMCEAATPGPWHANTSWFASEVTTNPEGSAYAWVCQLWYKDEEVMQNHKANAQFIAESREALPYWIKRAMAAEQKLSSHDPDGRNYSNIEFVMMRDRALAAEAEIDRLKKSLHFLVTAVKTGYRAGYIDGDGFGDALMDEVSKITV